MGVINFILAIILVLAVFAAPFLILKFINNVFDHIRYKRTGQKPMTEKEYMDFMCGRTSGKKK